MSADSNTVCPRCALKDRGIDLSVYTGPKKYPLVSPGVIDHAAEEFGLDRSVRENIDYHILARDSKLYLIFEYSADCWDCDWHHESTLEEQIPGIGLDPPAKTGDPHA